MNNRFTYFLLVAEELNMSRAAERAFISHQGISNTIKLLEQEYGVPLFHRQPKLCLTPTGETLVRALRQIKVIEDNLAAEISENSSEYRGKISLGVPLSRYEIIVPDIVPPFREQYPNVEIEIVSDYSKILEQMAVTGELDIYIGTGMINSDVLTAEPLMKEFFVLLISNRLLERYFGSGYQGRIDDFKRGVHLKNFEKVPFIQYPPYSRLRHAIVSHLEESDVHLRTIFESNHAMSFGELCRRNLGMGVVSKLFIPSIIKMNMNCREDEFVHAFPLNELPYCKTLSLAYHKARYLNKYHRSFIELIVRVFANYQAAIPDNI